MNAKYFDAKKECVGCSNFFGTDCTLTIESVCPKLMDEVIEFVNQEIRSIELAPKINGCKMTEEWSRQLLYLGVIKDALNKWCGAGKEQNDG